MPIISINERLPTPAKADATLTLSLEARQKSRQRVTLDSGEEMALTLPRGTCLRDGDHLRAEDGSVITVRAAPEPVTTARTDDPTLLARAAYHLGNRHVALEIGEGFVCYLEDHVLDAMVEALGLHIVRERRPFEPETGAYAGHSHEAPQHPLIPSPWQGEARVGVERRIVLRDSTPILSCHSFVKPPFFSQLPGCFPYRSYTLDFIEMQVCSAVWNMYSPSLDLVPKASTDGTPCEVDFVWIIPRAYPRKTAVILGERKDQGPITAENMANLKRIADALPRKRFKTFFVLSKLAAFSKEEVERAKALNDKYRQRVILLTPGTRTTTTSMSSSPSATASSRARHVLRVSLC